MKQIFYSIIFFASISFSSNAQIKNVRLEKQIGLMQGMHKARHSGNLNCQFPTKINPYWESIAAPHSYNNSFVGEIQLTSDNSIWTPIAYDSLTPSPFCNHFTRSADGGKTWQLGTINTPQGYVTYNLAAVDQNTCYASMFNGSTFTAGGIFKTTDGGVSWKQIGANQLFTDGTFNEFVYFFDSKHGFTVGDGNGADSSHLEIYTTGDAGATWQRVPDENIPPVTGGAAYSTFTHIYTTYQNRIWMWAYDAADNAYIYRSDDFGHHWEMFPFNLTDKSYEGLAFVDRKNGIAVGAAFDGVTNSYEAVTHDGGATWTEITPKGYVMGAFAAVIPGTHTYVTTLGGPGYAPVYGSSYSTDYGKSWKLIDSGIYASHCAIAFLNPFVGWTARDVSLDPNGGMFKWKYQFALNNGPASDDDASASIINKGGLFNEMNAGLYPNPAKDMITINNLDVSATTTLSLYSSSGTLIQQATTSSNSYSFNTQKLYSGSYYVIIQSAGKISTLKFVKQ